MYATIFTAYLIRIQTNPAEWAVNDMSAEWRSGAIDAKQGD